MARDRACHPYARTDLGVGAHHVDVGAGGNVGELARTDFEINRHRARSVDHVMAVTGVFWKGRAIAGPQNHLAAIFDQRQFAFEHVDEFVLVRMPVALARPIARRQVHEIDPEIREPAGIAESLPHAFGTGRVELRRIAVLQLRYILYAKGAAGPAIWPSNSIQSITARFNVAEAIMTYSTLMVHPRPDEWKARRSGRAATRASLPKLKQDVVLCFDWFELGLLAEHYAHLNLNTSRNE